MNKHAKRDSGLATFKKLMPVIGLLWVFLFLRIYRIEGVLPYFIDELRHIERGRIVWSFSELEISAHPGKFLLYYWLGIFELPIHQPGWIARTVVALFSVIGAAGTYALAKQLFSVRAGYLALFILTSLPFMLFYERLALSDPLAASLAVVMIWWVTVVVKYPTRRNGTILGLMLSLMLIAKILSAPLVMMPLVAIFLFSPYHTINLGQAWLPQIRQLFAIYRPSLFGAGLVLGTIWGVILAVYLGRGLLAPNETAPLVDRYLYEGVRRTTGESTEAPPWDLWVKNWWRFQEIVYYLWGGILIILAVVTLPALLRGYLRQFIYLFLALIMVWGLIIFSAGQLTTRYMTAAGHMLVILLAAGVWAGYDVLQQRFQRQWVSAILLIAVLIWSGTYSASFYTKLVTDPTQLTLPQRDKWEYFQNQTGYGLQTALLDISELPAVSTGEEEPLVYGMVRNCQYLESFIPEETVINIQCAPIYNTWPRRDFPNRKESYAAIEGLTRQYEQIYFIMEELDDPILDRWVLDAHLRYIKTYERPFDGVDVNLYIASPRDPLNVEFIEPN